MKMTHKNWLTAALLLICTVLVCTALADLPTAATDALLQGGSGETVTISREEYENLKRYAELEEIRELVDFYYYQDADEEKMLDYAAYGMLSALDDPYTFYYDPEAYAELWEDDEGEYAGIGIMITAYYDSGECVISRVFLNSPALEVGMRKGDILRTVEDLTVTAVNLQDAVDIMRGVIGEKVHVTVQRGDELIDFLVPRAQVHVNWVNSCMLDDEIGLITLYEFSGDCADNFRAHLNGLLDKGAKAVILDLRDNPGGWVNDAQSIADMFLDEGVLASVHYKDGTVEYYSTTTDNMECDVPLVVMLNENSASSSEILSGALQDRGRATIVGVQSYGKGVMQVVLPVGERGAGMQVTIARYLTPNDNEVHGIGITPDVVAELPEGDDGMYDLGDMSDPQLKVAYETAQGLIR